MSLRQSWTTDHDSLCSGYSSGGDLALPIEELNLMVRPYNRLKRAGIHACGELVALGERGLLAIEGFDSELAEEVEQRLADVGLSLRAAPPDGVREHSAFIRHNSWASVRAVAFHPDGHLLATAGWDYGVRLWEVSTCRLIALFTGHTDTVWSAAFHPAGHYLATASEDGTVRWWDATGQTVALFDHPKPVHTLAFHPDGHLLATGGEDGTVLLWDTTTGKPVGAPLAGHTDHIWSVAFHPGGHLLATGGADGTARLWDTATGRPLAVFSGHLGPVASVAFHPDGHLLATAGHDSATRLWDISAPHP